MRKRRKLLLAMGVLSVSMISNNAAWAEGIDPASGMSSEITKLTSECEETELQVETVSTETETVEQTTEPQTPQPAEMEPITEAPVISETESVSVEPEIEESASNEQAESEDTVRQKTEAETNALIENTETEKNTAPIQAEADVADSVAQDVTLHPIKDTSEVKVQISGFYVDPSKYPAADISENTKEIYSYLTKTMKLSHAAACGVLANIHLESNFNPLSLGDGGTSYGICQWHNRRFNNLIRYCNDNGLDYNTLDGQIQFMAHELETSYPNVLEHIKNVSDTSQGAYDAAHYWCVYYEAPSETYARAQQRGNLAMNSYYGEVFITTDFEYTELATVRELLDKERKSPKRAVENIRATLDVNLST